MQVDILRLVDYERSRLEGERTSVTREIIEACRDGVLGLINHGLPTSLLQEGQKVFWNFFESPVEVKMTGHLEGRGLGYLPFKLESLAASIGEPAVADLKESFNVGRFKDRQAWPSGFPRLAIVARQVYGAFDDLALSLLRLIARGLDERESVFDKDVIGGLSVLRATYYPIVDKEHSPDSFRAGPHTDYGTLSLLLPDPDVGGFEAYVGGEWIEVPPLSKDVLLVNVGDLLERWTNGILPATLHRVRAGGGGLGEKPRLSIVFLQNPLPKATIAPLPSCVARVGKTCYSPVLAERHLKDRSRLSRTFRQ
jgi:isopenicillin N synthase-like dioxygenase